MKYSDFNRYAEDMENFETPRPQRLSTEMLAARLMWIFEEYDSL